MESTHIHAHKRALLDGRSGVALSRDSLSLQPCMRGHTLIYNIALAHAVARTLHAALNEGAKPQPASPFRALSALLPVDYPKAVATLPSATAAAESSVEALRSSWLALHGLHDGVLC